MGLMDKFKNLFTDEEVEEEEKDESVEIKEIKKEEPQEENKLPTFMREKIEKEEKQKQTHETQDENISDFSLNKSILDMENNLEESPELSEHQSTNNDSNNSFKFPIAFEESDFTDISRVNRQAMRKQKNFSKEKETKVSPPKTNHKSGTKVAELYKEKKQEEIDNKKFIATPIISPIYGVLNKNYKKEELEPIKGDNYETKRPSKNLDFDSVRKKAYGTSLTEDIKNNLMCENCEYLKQAKDNLMYERLCEKEENEYEEIEDYEDPKYNNPTIDEATENYFDYGVEYEKQSEIQELEPEEEIKIVNHADEPTEPKKGVPPVKSSINLLSTLKKSMGEEEIDNTSNENKKNLELTDDLFNLIDSMYDEGKD